MSFQFMYFPRFPNTVNSDSEVTGYEAVNAVDANRSKNWQSVNDSSMHYIEYEYSSAITVSAVLVDRVHYGATSNVIKTYTGSWNTEGSLSFVYDYACARMRSGLVFDSARSNVTKVRLELTGSAWSGSYYLVGLMLVFSSSGTLGHGPGYGYSDKVVIPSEEIDLPDIGPKFIQTGAWPYRQIEFEIEERPDTETYTSSSHFSAEYLWRLCQLYGVVGASFGLNSQGAQYKYLALAPIGKNFPALIDFPQYDTRIVKLQFKEYM